jgi:hypothetical protein
MRPRERFATTAHLLFIGLLFLTLSGNSTCESTADQDGDGYTESEGDCDDSDPALYPGALELCDQRDNDCDAQIDEDLPTSTWYSDVDGDGHGTFDPTLESCDSLPPPGYASSSDDCDDADAGTYPGASDLIGDTSDSDCNGLRDIITSVAGYGTGDNIQATYAELFLSASIAIDRLGNLYFSEIYLCRIRRVNTHGISTTFAGMGLCGYSGDNGPATDALLNWPNGLRFDSQDNLYIADSYNHRVRKVSSSGVITTAAGNGTRGNAGDGGPAMDAQLNTPSAIALYGNDSFVIADYGNFRVRRVSSSGLISTIAGTGQQGYGGDGGPATSAQLSPVCGVAINGQGNVFISDSGNHRVRKVGPSGIITTVAGNGTAGDGDDEGDGGPTTNAQLTSPNGISVDADGTLWIADFGNDRIRKMS